LLIESAVLLGEYHAPQKASSLSQIFFHHYNLNHLIHNAVYNFEIITKKDLSQKASFLAFATVRTWLWTPSYKNTLVFLEYYLSQQKKNAKKGITTFIVSMQLYYVRIQNN